MISNVAGANLEQLRGCLKRAAAELVDRPATWSESLGKQLVPIVKPLYSTVSKADLGARIRGLLQAIDTAEEHGLEVHFLGD